MVASPDRLVPNSNNQAGDVSVASLRQPVNRTSKFKALYINLLTTTRSNRRTPSQARDIQIQVAIKERQVAWVTPRQTLIKLDGALTSASRSSKHSLKLQQSNFPSFCRALKDLTAPTDPAQKKEPSVNANSTTSYFSKHTYTSSARFRNKELKALVDKNKENHDLINLRGDRSVRKSDYRSKSSTQKPSQPAPTSAWEKNLWHFFKFLIWGVVCVMLWALL